MTHVRDKQEGVTGIALSAALGLGIGMMGGMFLRGLLGGAATESVRAGVRNLRKSRPDAPADPQEIEHAVSRALSDDPDTRDLAVRVESLGDGIVELLGSAPDPLSRQIAADIARAVPGADIVVNRILVERSDGAPAVAQPPSETS